MNKDDAINNLSQQVSELAVENNRLRTALGALMNAAILATSEDGDNYPIDGSLIDAAQSALNPPGEGEGESETTPV